MSESRGWALVTGGARRLGAAITRELSAAGYSVAIHFHESEAAAHALVDELVDRDREAIAYQADLRDPSDCRGLVAAAWSELEAVSLLVNNAGSFGSGTGLAEEEDFDRTIALNLRAPYLLSRQLGDLMRASRGGAIVNVASVGGIRPYGSNLPYSLSKAGLIMLTRGLAKELAPYVRVNAVAPGSVDMPGEEGEAPLGPLNRIPAGRHGRSTEVAAAVAFLATAEYCSGQVLAIDGGMSL
ncbi:MAG TPA: SDR family NAD(P)-dependent oxidoreductase [Candidatus Krumholzibacteria bacterium]|jgi:pteridine reductase